jgi:hypothetical protein
MKKTTCLICLSPARGQQNDTFLNNPKLLSKRLKNPTKMGYRETKTSLGIRNLCDK